MKRTLRTIGFSIGGLLLLLLVSALAAGWWLFATESGGRFVLTRAQQASGNALTIGTSNGTLQDGLRLNNVSYTDSGLTTRIDQLQLQMRFRWLPTPRLTIEQLHGDTIDVVLESSDPQSSDTPRDLPDLTSPLAVYLEDVRFSNIVLTLPSADADLNAEIARPLLIDQLSGKLDYHRAVTLHMLNLQGHDLNIDLNGSAELAPPYQHDLNLSGRNGHSDLLAAELQGMTASLTSKGSLEQLNVELVTSNPPQNTLALSLQGSLSNLITDPAWDIQVSADSPMLQWPANDVPQVVIDKLALASNGSLNTGYTATINTHVNYPLMFKGDWSLRGTGSEQTLTIDQLAGPLLAGSMNASGYIEWSNETPVAQMTVEIANVQPPLDTLGDMTAINMESLSKDIPAGISGKIVLALSDDIALVQSMNLHVPDTDWQLNGNAQYQLNNQQIAADLRWQQLSWPPQFRVKVADSSPVYASSQGTLIASGELSQLDINLQTDISGQSIPSATLDLQATLNDEQLQVQPLLIETLDGQVDINGQLNRMTQNWQVSLTASNLNPELHWPAYPGNVNLEAEADGQLPDASRPLEAVIRLKRLNGELRGQPLSGSGDLRYVDGLIRTEGLTIRSGDADISLAGTTEQLQAEINIPRLQDILPAATGQLNATLVLADISKATNIPATVTVNAALDNMQWRDYQLNNLRLESRTGLESNHLTSTTTLLLDQLQLPQQPVVESINLDINIAPPSQTLTLSADQSGNSLTLAMRGQDQQWQSVNSWSDLLYQGWQGELHELSVKPADRTAWSLQSPAAIMASAERQLLETLCLRPEDQPGSACIEFQHASTAANLANHPTTAQLTLIQLPLSLLDGYLMNGITSSQQVSGQIQTAWQTGFDSDLTTLNASFTVTAGEVNFIETERPPLALGETLITAELDAQNHIATRLQSDIERQNTLDSLIRYGPLDSDTPQIAGRIAVDMPDLAWLQKPLVELDAINGSLQLTAELQGPPRQPLISLDVDLHDGLIVYQPLGLQLSAIQLHGNSEPGQALQATGSFMAGSGSGELAMMLTPLERELSLNVTGTELELLGSQALQLTASPDIALNIAPDGYQINGSIAIPRALLKPPEGIMTQVKESDDLIVLNAPAAAIPEPRPVPVSGQLIVSLGDNVKVDADVARTLLTGEVTLNWDNQQLPEADGEIRLIDGRIQAYGQSLELRRSRVNYNNTPVDNPELSIQAVRDIFGDPRVSEAGVLVSGPAQEPSIRVFTNPASDKDSALAYIATGNDFDYANGQGALNLGIYLFPRLFVSYGLGLFDNGNTANARYEFSDNWNLSVESGARDTGVDLNWRKSR